MSLLFKRELSIYASRFIGKAKLLPVKLLYCLWWKLKIQTLLTKHTTKRVTKMHKGAFLCSNSPVLTPIHMQCLHW